MDNRAHYLRDKMEPLAAGVFALMVYQSRNLNEDDTRKRAKDAIAKAKIFMEELEKDHEEFKKEHEEAGDD